MIHRASPIRRQEQLADADSERQPQGRWKLNERELFNLLAVLLGLFVVNDILNPWGNVLDLRYYSFDLAIYLILLLGLFSTRKRRREVVFWRPFG
jgi:hypothetical protein